MTLRLIALAAAIILPVAIPMTANAAGNLVTNGSFELTSTTSPDGNFQFSAGNANYNYGTVTGWASAAKHRAHRPFQPAVQVEQRRRQQRQQPVQLQQLRHQPV